MEETHTGTEKNDIKRITFILCALKIRMYMILYMFSHGFNRTEDSSVQALVFSLYWTWERRCEGTSARHGCDVNVMIPELPGRILVFGVLSVISRWWPLLSTPPHFDMQRHSLPLQELFSRKE